MKRLIAVIIVVHVFVLTCFSAYANTVGLFYAIDSSNEFEQIKANLGKGQDNVYFQWARLARNKDNHIQFTTKSITGISQFDNRVEYGMPRLATGESIKEYEVQPGESLKIIASKYGMSYKELGEYNNITDYDSIKAGQKIKIPSIEEDTSIVDSYKEISANTKAYLSVFFEADEFSDKKNSQVEFLNMSESEWLKYIISPMTQTLELRGFDGVVLDFEAFRDSVSNKSYSVEKRTGLKEKFNKFIALLKKNLNGKLLNVIVHPTNVGGYFDGYDFKKLSALSDGIILMSYDYQSFNRYKLGDPVPAELLGKIKEIVPSRFSQPYVQPADKVSESVTEAIKLGAIPEKLLLGINIVPVKWIKYSKTYNGKKYVYYEYHRNYLSTVGGGSKQSILDKTALIEKKILSGSEISSEERSKLKVEGAYIESIEYHYESQESLNKKYYKLVMDNKLAGVTVWRIGAGSEKIWDGILEMFGTEIILKIGEPYMEFNGVKKEIDPGRGTAPIIKDSRTIVPIRAIIESLGGTVVWEPETKRIIIDYASNIIDMKISEEIIYVNEVEKNTDVAPQIINGRTYLPLRFLLENLGFEVDYESSSKTITIK